MEGNSPEKCNDNILYNDNYIKNYEDLACCNNLIFSTIIQENGNNFMNYINDICFRKEDINDNEEIMKYPSQKKITTPLCSNNNNIYKNNNSIINSNIINNNINNSINYNNDIHDNKSILSENQSNNSAADPADPIMSIKKFNTLVNQNKNKKRNLNHKNRRNLFSILSDLFKDFFDENEKVKNEKDKNDNLLNLKHRPILKRIIEKDILSPFQLNNNKGKKNRNDNLSISLNRANTFQHQNNNHNISSNAIIYERRELFADDILSYDISEEKDDENIKEFVSYIPIFKVKEKEKSFENNNKCSICLCEFEIGEEKSTLPCLHYFHFNCIEKWIKRKKYCPICKYQLSFESLRKNIEYDNIDN